MTLNGGIAALIAYAEKYLGLEKRNEIYIKNRLADILGVIPDNCEDVVDVPELPNDILDGIFACLEEQGKEFDRATLGEKLMDAVILLPDAFENEFEKRFEKSSKDATAWSYDYAIRSDYVKKRAIDKNLKWTSRDGRIEITINLSKPEKNNKDLLKQITTASVDYPKCTICRENEGFERVGFSRRNMRTVSMRLDGADWFWQYSPYAYFNEHGIAISCEHTPMILNEHTVEHLFDFVDMFPHYFIGNNAPLPRVGGSILMHNHYQGGGAVLPMQKVGSRIPLDTKDSKVKACVLDWYNTAIRLEGEDRAKIAAVARRIFTAWESFEAPELDIISHTGSEKHNTASCIARKNGKTYILDMILRNNRTSEKYPDGIFHAHREYHHIKSESIGLIEAMGLFILPARLKRQLGEIKTYLTGEKKFVKNGLSDDMKIFIPMIDRLIQNGKVSERAAEDLLRDEVESVCKNILDNTAVFKRDEKGDKALIGFLKGCGLAAKE